MTILYPERFHQARPASFDGVFDWDFLRGCFPRPNIMPMDFDAVVEINGNFLVFETKDVGKEVPIGQRYTLEALVRDERWTVFFLYGKTPETIERLGIWWRDRTWEKPANVEVVKRHVSRWANWAEKRNRW